MTLYALLLGLVEPETVAVVAADGGAAMACALSATQGAVIRSLLLGAGDNATALCKYNMTLDQVLLGAASGS